MEVEDLSFGGRDLLHGEESDFWSSRFVELSCFEEGRRGEGGLLFHNGCG